MLRGEFTLSLFLVNWREILTCGHLYFGRSEASFGLGFAVVQVASSLHLYLMVSEISSQLYFDCHPQRNTLALTVKVSPTFCFMNVPLRLKLDIGSQVLVSLHI